MFYAALIGVAIVGYLVLSGKASALTSSLSSVLSSVSSWPPSEGQPGYVTIDSQPVQDQYYSGNTSAAVTGYAGQGVAAVGSIASLSAGGAGGIAGVASSAAIPIIGIGIGIITTITSIISKHHQEMVAKEAAELNQAVPIIMQRYVLIMQAVVRGEITTKDQAWGQVQQAIVDYYTFVKPMLQGKWPWPTDQSSGALVSEPKKPSTCNGPCVVGHYWIETGANMVYNTAIAIISNRHGIAVLGPIPSHAGFVGMGKIQMVY
jgi:hypothetical protein